MVDVYYQLVTREVDDNDENEKLVEVENKKCKTTFQHLPKIGEEVRVPTKNVYRVCDIRHYCDVPEEKAYTMLYVINE